MKGFVYSLESVIASTIIISMILVVIPQVTENPDVDLEPVMTGLESLDQVENLGKSPENISNSIEDFIPTTFNYSIRVVETETTDLTVTGDRSVKLNSGYKKTLFWIEDADNLEITFKNETVLQTSEDGYHEAELGSESGYLNFTSDNVDLNSEINTYTSEGRFLDGDTVYLINYIDIEEDAREIRVILSG